MESTVGVVSGYLSEYLRAVEHFYAPFERPYGDFPYPDPGLFPNLRNIPSRAIIIGEPGSGKTTVLDWLALRFARSRTHVPIFASLGRYGSTVADLLQASIERFSSVLQFEDLLTEGRPLALLLDGLDEVAPGLRHDVEEEIRVLDTRLVNSTIVLTSRPTIATGLAREWANVAIQSLGEAQIAAYLQTVPGGGELEQRIRTDDRLAALVKRPIFLFSLAHAWQYGDEATLNVAGELVRYASWRGHTKSSLPADIGAPLIEDVLVYLALRVGVSGFVTFPPALIMEVAASRGVSTEYQRALVDGVLSTGVVAQHGPGLRFTHAMFLEAYSARALLSLSADPVAVDSALAAMMQSVVAPGVARTLLAIANDAELRVLLASISPTTRTSLFQRAQADFAERLVGLTTQAAAREQILRNVARIQAFADRRDREREDILVIAVHGFNTRGDWKNRFGFLLTKETDGTRFLYRAWDYGGFRLGILNPFARRAQVKKFQGFYNALLESLQPRPSKVCIVAHSFGTYIVGHALRRFPEVAFSRLLFLGSALPRRFDWNSIGSRVQLALNIVGGGDSALTWARLIPGLGDAGLRGFGPAAPCLKEHVEHNSDHSDLFGNEYMRVVWVPFLRSGVVPTQ